MGMLDGTGFGLDDAVATGSESLIAQQLRLQQRQKQLIRDAEAIQPAPQGQMVSGRYVAPSLGAQLVPMFARAMNQYQQTALDKESSNLDRQVATAANQHLASAPGPDASPQQKMAWAQRGAQIPTLAPLMQAYAQDQLVNEPTREQTRQDKKDAQAATLEQKRDAQAAQLQYNRERDQQRADNDQANRDLRATLAAAVRAGSGGGGGGGSFNYMGETEDGKSSVFYNPKTGQTNLGPPKPEKPAKPLPSSQATAWVNNDKSIAQIDSALALLDTAAGKDATGFKGYLPNAVLQRADPKGVDARAAVANIGSLKIHDRSGAAVTVSETPRLLPFIPLTTDDTATAKKKLRGLKNELLQSQQSIQDFADSQGYKAPVSSTTTPAPTAAAAPSSKKAPTVRESLIEANKQLQPPKSIDELLKKYE